MISPKVVSALGAVGLMLGLTGCAGFSSGNSTNTQDFYLVVTPTQQTVAKGANTSFTATISAQGGFTGTVQLAVSGLPSGVTASLSSSTVNGSGAPTVSVSASSTAAAGTYSITVSGSSGALAHNAVVGLVISNSTTPDFSMSSSPNSQTVTAGNSASFTITTSAVNGFTGTIGLAESGMPAGMLASCNPSSINGAGLCTLNVTTSSSTAAGTYTLTITGTSGTLVHSTSVDVTVNPVTLTPDFSVSALPSSQNVTAGNSVSFTATVAAQNGFTGTVALGASGLPTGVTASFTPTSIAASGSSTLTLTSATTTAAGTYSVTINGTSGTLAHNTSVSLVVTASSSGNNYTTCSGQQVPNWESSTFTSNYKAATAALVNHLKSAPYSGQIGYVRVGLGRGGEINLPQGWDDSTSGSCYAAYTTAWGYAAGSTSDNWNAYLQGMVQYEATLSAPFPVLVSITPITDVGIEPDDFIAGVAHQSGISFGNQGLEASDITNYPTCGGDWCNLFAQYPSTAVRELQTLGQSCPSGTNACPNGNTLTNSTGSLASSTAPTLLAFATAHGGNNLELYYQDWLVAFESGYNNPVDSNSGQYQTAYANAITTASSSAKMQILFPPTISNDADFAAVQTVIASQPSVVTGVVLSVDWSDFDPGNGNTSGNYDWTITDAEINLYAALGIKVNVVLQNSTYGGSTCPTNGGVGSNGNVGNNCAMPPWMWTALQ